MKMKTKNFVHTFMTIMLSTGIYAQDFTEAAKIVASDRAAGDYFGYSVSISGNYAIVGAYFEMEDNSGGNTLPNAGSAYIFERDDKGDWNEVQKIIPSDRTAGDFFGYSVCISGNSAIVGAFNKEGISSSGDPIPISGSAYIFKRDGNGNWIEAQKIVASDRATMDFFGYSVSISCNYAIVGALYEEEDASGANMLYAAGSAYIFKRDGNDNWSEVQKLAASDRAVGDRFGNSVSISGNYVIVGAYCEYEDASGGNTIANAGSAYIFECDGNGNWSEVQKIVASDRARDDIFGTSVCISGNYAVVGASGGNYDAIGDNEIDNAGSAYIFEREGNGYWRENQKIVASDRAKLACFGNSVGISDNYAIVGAFHENKGGQDEDILNKAGSAYIFRRNGNNNWNEIQKIVAYDRAADDEFGISVSISGNYSISGACLEDENANGENTIEWAGSAYIFEDCIPSKNVDPENIIENGDFESCVLSPWQTYVYDPAVNTVNAVLADGECRFSGLTVSNNPMAWHIQLLQTFTGEQKSRLEAGATYKLSFDAKAEAESKELYLFFGQNEGNPWTAFVNENIIVGTEIENFSFEFTLNSVLPLMRVLFGFGHDPAGLTIDNVRLVKKAGPVSGITQNELEVMRVFPNPAFDLLNIQGANGSIVSLMDMLGTLIFSEVIHDNHAILNLQTIPDGVYLIQLKTDQDSYTQIILIQPK